MGQCSKRKIIIIIYCWEKSLPSYSVKETKRQRKQDDPNPTTSHIQVRQKATSCTNPTPLMRPQTAGLTLARSSHACTLEYSENYSPMRRIQKDQLGENGIIIYNYVFISGDHLKVGTSRLAFDVTKCSGIHRLHNLPTTPSTVQLFFNHLRR